MSTILTMTTPTERNDIPLLKPYNPENGNDFRRLCPCGNERPIVAKLHGDPYCSNVCAREAYGNPMPTNLSEKKTPAIKQFYRKPKKK